MAILAESWRDSNPTKELTSLATDESALRNHILPTLGKRKIATVTPFAVQQLVNSWVEELQPRTVRRQYETLRAMFFFAVNNEWLLRSPCRQIKLPTILETRKFQLTDEQIVTLVSFLNSKEALRVYIGATTGLRWGEVAGLAISSLNLLRNEISVFQSVGRDAKGTPFVKSPKTQASNRTLTIPSWLSGLIAAYLAERGFTASDSKRLIFEGPRGELPNYNNWRNRVWLAACRKANCEGAGFHDLRRYAATSLVLEGVDLKTVQTRLGHRDPRMTLTIYAQAVPEADIAAAEKVGAKLLDARKGNCAKYA